MSGKASQRKGAAGEKELRDYLQEHGYSGVQRGGSMTFGTIADLYGLPGIHLEVKRVEALNLEKAMNQSIEDSKRMKDGKPTVVHRKNRRPWMVTMLLDDWLELYGKAGI